MLPYCRRFLLCSVRLKRPIINVMRSNTQRHKNYSFAFDITFKLHIPFLRRVRGGQFPISSLEFLTPQWPQRPQRPLLGEVSLWPTPPLDTPTSRRLLCYRSMYVCAPSGEFSPFSFRSRSGEV